MAIAGTDHALALWIEKLPVHASQWRCPRHGSNRFMV
jgi:hypothetical protein